MQTNTMNPRSPIGAGRLGVALAAAFCLTVVNASAETLLMPSREFVKGTSGVVWGISTQATTTSCSLDFGDGNVVSCVGADRSYIAFDHTYNSAGTKTVQLTVNGETASVNVTVHDAALLNDADQRAVGINMAIQDGLRYFWFSQTDRSNFDTSQVTHWSEGNRPIPMTSLVVLSLENHGYLLPNNNSDPIGIYPKYLVRRGLNYIAANLTEQLLDAQPAGDPCVGSIPEPCRGFIDPDESGYATAVAALPFAASTAFSRQLPAGLGGEDLNANGINDAEVDVDGDGVLDTYNEDSDGDGVLDKYYDCEGDANYINEDTNGNGVLDMGEDTDGDGVLDRAYVDCDGDGDYSEEDWNWDGHMDVDEDWNDNYVFDDEDLNNNGILDPAFVSGQTIGEVLQRLVNAISWGQNDFSAGNDWGRGGWYYSLADGYPQSSDGSTVGWDVLALLDSGAAGATIPTFVKPEFGNFALGQGLNDNGTFDYQADSNAASYSSVNQAKTGIGLQGLFFAGRPDTDAQVQLAIDYISNNWNNNGVSFTCYQGTGNKGCGYAMFNVFKGLKLYGINSLPGIGDPDGAGPLAPGDWHGDYEDYLVANQTNPGTQNGGQWALNGLGFSCCHDSVAGITALAELVLAPVALISPDPEFFGTLGLTHTATNSTDPATNPSRTPHSVTATAKGFPTIPGDDSSRPPVPGATVDFHVLSGPNAGKEGSDITDQNGAAHFDYTDDGTPRRCDVDADNDVDATDLALVRAGYGPAAAATTMTDQIRANIGSINSNTVLKHWSISDRRDGTGDGVIDVRDYRYCATQKTN